VPRIEVAGDIYLRWPRPTQGYRADDDDEQQHTLQEEKTKHQPFPYTDQGCTVPKH
jgi:hypothetical protein